MKEPTQISLASNQLAVNVAAVAMLGLMAILMFSSAWNDTITFDEAPHIGAGYAYLRKADFRLNPEHPPLLKDLASFPLLFMKLHVDWNHKSWTEDPFGQWDFGLRLIFNSGKDADSITRAAKSPMIVFTIVLGGVIFWWARNQFGGAVALLSLFLFVFSPTFLAHGRFVTTDVGATAGFFVGTICFLRFLTNPTRSNVALAGLAMGFSFLTKFSTFMLIPIALILAVVWALLHKNPASRSFLRYRKLTGGSFVVPFRVPYQVSDLLRYLTRTVCIIGIAFIVIYPVYLHHTWNYPPQRQRAVTESGLIGHGVGHTPKDIVIWVSDKPGLRPWAEYFLGLFQAIQRSVSGNNPFFLGKIYATGSRLYFPFVYLVKEPLALHGLTILALLFALSQLRRPLLSREALQAHFTEFAFLVVIAFYWWVAIRSNLNIGVRHVLPTFPFIYILVANEVTVLYRRLLGQPPMSELCQQSEAGEPHQAGWPAAIWGFRPIGAFPIILCALLVWQATTVLRVHPSYLAYFNELAGGPNGGWQYVNDSNLDWGQDLKRLSEFVEERAIPKIQLDYFGSADPAYYLKEKYRGISKCSELQKGWVAVSATVYPGVPWRPECDYRRWLPMEKIVTKIGYSIFVFRIE